MVLINRGEQLIRNSLKSGAVRDEAILGDSGNVVHHSSHMGYVRARKQVGVNADGTAAYSPYFLLVSDGTYNYPADPNTPVYVEFDPNDSSSQKRLRVGGMVFDGALRRGINPVAYNAGLPINTFTATANLSEFHATAISAETDSLVVGVQPLALRDNAGAPVVFGGDVYDFTSDLPGSSNEKALALLYLDISDMTLGAHVGTAQADGLDFDFVDALTEINDLLEPSQLPNSVWLLKNGDTRLTNSRKWHDYRQIFNAPVGRFLSTSAPASGDDEDDGYAVGDIVVDTTNDEIYIARDVASGAAQWERLVGANRNGWAEYIDNTTSGTPISLSADTWTDITNDGAGATITTYLPDGVTQLLDTATGYLDLTDLDIGDEVFVTIDIEVTPDSNNTVLEFRFQAGTGGSTYELPSTVAQLNNGSSTAHHETSVVRAIVIRDANTRDNPVKMQVRLSDTGDLVNNGVYISTRKVG